MDNNFNSPKSLSDPELTELSFITSGAVRKKKQYSCFNVKKKYTILNIII